MRSTSPTPSGQTPIRLHGTRRPLRVAATDHPDLAVGDVYLYQGNVGPYGVPWVRGRNGGTDTNDAWGFGIPPGQFTVWAGATASQRNGWLPRHHALPVGIYFDGTSTTQLTFGL